MNPFAYTRVDDVGTAVREIAADGTAKFIAGGTNLIDLMKEHVERPARLIDINHLPLRDLEPTGDGGVRLGALLTNTAVAYHPEIEVRVDEDLGTVHVTRVVSAIAGGRVLNPKTARSQIVGSVVWGIGMALEEESVLDHAVGRFMTHNLADYHIPVNADVHDIEVIFVEERDEVINPLGAKGLGEIGIVGVATAIANAVYHATGKRVRDLPITLDKLL